MINYPGHFSRNLKMWREWRGLSMRELARRSEMSASVISAIEGDPEPNPRLETLHKLANGLRVPLETLLKPNSYEEYEARLKRLTREYADV